MSNSFNISLASEIASVKSIVDENKVNITYLHVNDFPILHAVILNNEAKLGTIINTDLPAVKADTADIRTDVTIIHDTTLGAMNSYITDIRNEVRVIDPIVDAIKLKTDDIQQNVRGDYTLFYATSNSIVEVEVCNITGHGKLNYLWGRCANAADTVSIVIYLDGIPSRELIHTGDTIIQMIIISDNYNVETFFQTQFIPHDEATQYLMNLEFATSCQITVRRSAGTTDLVHCKACVSIDPF